jgi:hypothetical protein
MFHRSGKYASAHRPRTLARVAALIAGLFGP